MVERADPTDTSREAAVYLANYWRSKTGAERFAAFSSLQLDVERLARAGVTAHHPGWTDAQVTKELFRRRYGQQLADEVYGGTLHR